LATEKIVGMEFWNKTSGFSTFYYNSYNGSLVEGYITGDGMAFYDEALQRGWKIGAQGSEDNHIATWGALTNYKTAVLASANTRTDLLDAYKAKRFYSTRYNSISMSFKIDGNEMGSTVTPGTKDIQIQISESNASRTVRKVELIKNGVILKTWNPSLSNVSITETIDCNNGDYYYIRTHEYYYGNPNNDYCQITAVSSPIWVEGQVQPNTPPVAMNDTKTTEEDTPVTFNVIVNDYDIDGEIDITTVDLDPETSGRQTQNIISAVGTYTADNSGNITFTPVKDYNGTTIIDYTVNDNSGAASNIATISINVTPVEDVQTLSLIHI
jgi:alpha-L-arabinofuranosidase